MRHNLHIQQVQIEDDEPDNDVEAEQQASAPSPLLGMEFDGAETKGPELEQIDRANIEESQSMGATFESGDVQINEHLKRFNYCPPDSAKSDQIKQIKVLQSFEQSDSRSKLERGSTE